MRLASLLALGSCVAALGAPAAAADGLPVLGIDVGGEGVAGKSDRYVTVTLTRETVVARVEQDGGRIIESRVLRGRFTIPAVAYDGSAAGLAVRGRTLVLVRPRAAFPQRTTRFAVLSTYSLRLREVLELRGDFSFDAISPDGRWLYLVQYLSPRDPSRYLVRLYDLRRGRLQREPIIDPREVGDVMRGEPVTRAASEDGRWAYTLYAAPDHPFVHALDTVGRTARCIDLHHLKGDQDLTGLELAITGTALEVRRPDRSLAARIDTSTFGLLPLDEAKEQPAAAAAVTRSPRDDSFWPLLALAAPGLALFGTAFALTRARRRRG